jgi:hypothetical protein
VGAALRQIVRLRIWVPLLVLALVQTAVLHGLATGLETRLAPVTHPLAAWVGGEGATHYPFFYYYLPALFSRVDYVLAVFLGSLAVGVATLRFAAAYGRPQAGTGWSAALRRFPALVVAFAVLVAAVLLVYELLAGLSTRAALSPDPVLRWGARALELVLIGVVQGLLAYTTAWIVLRGRGPLRAVGNSASTALRLLGPTALIVGIPLVLLFPLRYLMGRVDLFLDKLRPETLVWILQANIVAELLVGFLVVGSITRLFLYRTEEAT